MRIADALVALGYQEFVCNDTYESIKWIVEPDSKPTKKQVEDMAKQIPILEQQQKQEQEALKLSAIAKLAKLGLTEDEAKAIIGIQ